MAASPRGGTNLPQGAVKGTDAFLQCLEDRSTPWWVPACQRGIFVASPPPDSLLPWDILMNSVCIPLFTYLGFRAV